MNVQAFFADLARDGSAPLQQWPLEDELWTYGLEAVDDRVVASGRRDPLRAEPLRDALSRRARGWLRRLDVYPVTGSTSAELMGRAEQGSVDGELCLAELQLQGRGRRGRSWFSPFGANLALSLGYRMHRPASELGGTSLVVGLAVLDALEQLDVPDLALKWPNDVLLGGAKLGGILIELTRRAETELVVGIGLNVVLPERIRAELPRDVADLSHLRVAPRRNELAARIVSSTVEFLQEVDAHGFAPFRAAFLARHHYHGRSCRILQGESAVAGVASGITDQGELILDTADGPRTFHGGEVSLRQ